MEVEVDHDKDIEGIDDGAVEECAWAAEYAE